MEAGAPVGVMILVEAAITTNCLATDLVCVLGMDYSIELRRFLSHTCFWVASLIYQVRNVE